MINSKTDMKIDASGKLSARMSVFAWIICAVVGWGLAFTSFNTITGDEEGLTITAQSAPSAEDAANMEQVLPAAGNTTQEQ